MKVKAFNVKSIYQLLKSRQFINPISYELNKNTHTLLEYGVPGTYLRQNIKRKWWRLMLEEQSNAFPVETSALHLDNYLSLSSNENAREKLSLDCDEKLINDYRQMYLDVSKLTKSCLPFSVVSSRSNLNIGDSLVDEKSQEKNALPRSLKETVLESHCYTSPSGVSRIFDYWLQKRLSWWKKYAKNPSKFSVSSSTERRNENGGGMTSSSNVTSIDYEFPWGAESVEVLHNHGDAFFQRLPESEQKSFMAKGVVGKKVVPFCIQCSMCLETAVSTFLLDAYHERSSVSPTGKSPRMNPVLQLHPQLSPFQSALMITSDDTASTSELFNICAKLEQDIQQAGVSVFNASRHGATPEAHFRRNDQLGIPYSLIMNEKTLVDGSIIARCRDTEIMKLVHISRAVEDLKRNVEACLE